MKSRFTDLQFSTTHHTPTDKTPSLGSLFRTKNTISYKNIQADHCQKTLVKNELPIFIFDLSGNTSMYNGSVRLFWTAPNYGYFDNSKVVKPLPTKYLK